MTLKINSNVKRFPRSVAIEVLYIILVIIIIINIFLIYFPYPLLSLRING